LASWAQPAPWYGALVRARLVAGSLALLGVCAGLQHLACEVVFPTVLDAGSVCTEGGDTASDPENCGACGNACAAGVGCFRSQCGGAEVTQISAGMHACAVVKAGTVFCWGSNLFGETGTDPSTTTVSTPTEVAGLKDVVEVRAGTYSTCVRRQDGSVWCWGQNQAGQLGHAPSAGDQTCGSAPCNPVPQQVPGLVAKAIDVGDLFACALVAGGTISCWGDDTYGELGSVIEAGATSVPTPVLPVSLSGATSVSTGLDPHACAVFQQGRIACWGENGLGALGHNPALDPSCAHNVVACQAAPYTVSGVSGATAVRAGVGVTCALVDGGAVSCWGDDGLGQFGNGATDGGGVQFVPQPAAGGQAFVALDERYDFALALDRTGQVWAWGSSSRGALGNQSIGGSPCDDDAAPCVPTPTRVALTLPEGGTVTQVSAGDEFGLALDSTGVVWSWGANVDGRLGHAPGAADAGDRTNCGAPVMDEICNPTPSRVPFP
jgi:alpha-tubulin suppressor-like RCC1 family protein